MDDNTTAIIIVGMVMLPAIMFVRYLFGRDKHRSGPQADTAQAHAGTQALMEAAARMERRIENLEMLLDSELPGWRSRSRS